MTPDKIEKAVQSFLPFLQKKAKLPFIYGLSPETVTEVLDFILDDVLKEVPIDVEELELPKTNRSLLFGLLGMRSSMTGFATEEMIVEAKTQHGERLEKALQLVARFAADETALSGKKQVDCFNFLYALHEMLEEYKPMPQKLFIAGITYVDELSALMELDYDNAQSLSESREYIEESAFSESFRTELIEKIHECAEDTKEAWKSVDPEGFYDYVCGLVREPFTFAEEVMVKSLIEKVLGKNGHWPSQLKLMSIIQSRYKYSDEDIEAGKKAIEERSMEDLDTAIALKDLGLALKKFAAELGISAPGWDLSR